MNKYRAALLGCTAAAALALAAPSANADGMGRKSVKDDCCVNWGGIYLGMTAGWHWTDIDGSYVGGGTTVAPLLAGTINPAAGARHDVDHDSGIVGGVLGIQGQWGGVVLGLEANWSGAVQGDLWGVSRAGTAGCGAGTGLGVPVTAAIVPLNCEARLEYLFTVGPRIGFAWDRAMVFVTGGYAQASIASHTQTVNVLGNNTLHSHTKAPHEGWFLGGGVEWAVTKNVFIGVEYQRVSLDSERHSAHDGPGVAYAGLPASVTNQGVNRLSTHDRDFEADTDIIRARVTFKLDKDCCGRPLK